MWLKGHDISDFNEGKGVFNFEHENSRADDIVGKVVSAKKIFSKKDCDSDREEKFWELTKKPFLYVIGELFDDELHPGSIALAAMMRHYVKSNESILVGMSIEGQTLDREGQNLNRTIGRRIALTLRPCNKACVADILDDPNTKDFAERSFGKKEDSKLIEIDSIIIEDTLNIEKPLDLVDLAADLEKTLTAGGYNVAPSSLTGGAALAVEDQGLRTKKNKFKAAVRDWDRKRPLKEYLKAALPEVDDKYIEHFTDLTNEIHLKKGESPLIRISKDNSTNKTQDVDQQNLVDGMHWDHLVNVPSEGSKNQIMKLQNDSGEHVIVKYPYKNKTSGLESAKASTMYHDMAKNFFGMGQHVPTTNHFRHPDHKTAMDNFNPKEQEFHKPDGDLFSAMAFQDGAVTPFDSHTDISSSIGPEHQNNGTIDKMMAMDYLMGHTDRTLSNMMISKNGTPLHIDNDEAFEYDEIAPHSYLDDFNLGDQSIHPEAANWLNSLNPQEMVDHMRYHGADHIHTSVATDRLNMLKAAAEQGVPWSEIDEHLPYRADYE